MARASQTHLARTGEKRIALAQHFLRRRTLARQLVLSSSITGRDTVIEIGAGKGIFTRELAAVAGRVVAVEKDRALAAQLQKHFHGTEHVSVVRGDFLRTRLPERGYKVFANIPFNRTASIMRKLLLAVNPPLDGYLVMQKEAAQKFAGTPHETQFSVLTKPWFAVRIMRQFRRSDFAPAPRVDCVLLHIQKRDPPLVVARERAHYQRFVRQGFRGRKQSLRLTYKQTFTYRQWKRLAHELDFPRDAVPTALTFSQWLGLFRFLRGTKCT